MICSVKQLMSGVGARSARSNRMTNRKLLRACVSQGFKFANFNVAGQRGQDHVVSMSRSNLEYGAIIDADDENDGDLVLSPSHLNS